MPYRTIEIEDRDYQDLERAAKNAGVTIQLFLKQLITKQQVADKDTSHKMLDSKQGKRKKSRWALFSERIRKNPPLRGAGEYVRQCSKEFREDFAFKHDEE